MTYWDIDDIVHRARERGLRGPAYARFLDACGVDPEEYVQYERTKTAIVVGICVAGIVVMVVVGLV